MSGKDRVAVAVLLVEAVVLAVLEVFFLNLRFDGTLLPDLWDFPFPVTVLVAMVTTPWLVITAAKVHPKMSVAGSPLLVWLVTLGLFGFSGPGGDVTLLADWRALLLLGAGAMPAAVTVGAVMGRPPVDG
ncbi:hypothetical protein [Umezawaea beigongshangensis]|uniref:hypothetical protein n=1 Tax=Umezawaea beigongshangensis TaxID=2780383 RepID=UPI0018F174E0|nr:hypothetical protein [Umezawaea beigongshangensis]